MKLKFALLLFVFLLLAAFAFADSGKGLILKVEAGSASNAYLGLGDFLYKAGLKHRAEAAYLKSIQLEDTAVARHNLGIAYHDLNEPGKAAEHFRAAIALNPDYARARNSLAVLLFGQGRLEEAAEHFRILTHIEPGNAQAHFDLGVSLANNVRDGFGSPSDLVEARESFLAAESLSRGYPHAASNADVLSAIIAST